MCAETLWNLNLRRIFERVPWGSISIFKPLRNGCTCTAVRGRCGPMLQLRSAGLGLYAAVAQCGTWAVLVRLNWTVWPYAAVPQCGTWAVHVLVRQYVDVVALCCRCAVRPLGCACTAVRGQCGPMLQLGRVALGRFLSWFASGPAAAFSTVPVDITGPTWRYRGCSCAVPGFCHAWNQL